MIFLLFISIALGFEKDFIIVNQRAPLEFVHLFESLKYSIKANTDKVRLVSYCEKINEALLKNSKEEVQTLMKSEITKGVLEYHISSTLPPPITSLNLERLRENLKINDLIYSPFSKWIIRSIIADLEPFEKNDLINKYFHGTGNTSEQGLKILKLKRIARYLAPWVNVADALAPQDFNSLSMKVSWHLLDLILEKSHVMKMVQIKEDAKEEKTFNIPEMSYLYLAAQKKNKESKIPKTIKEQAEEEKNKALEETKKIELDPYKNPADLSQAIDQKIEELPEESAE